MGSELVMVVGDTGSGKSYSLRNFPRGECVVANVADKRYPFSPQPVTTGGMLGYADVRKAINDCAAQGANCIVVDDATFLMLRENEARAYERGYEKFTEFAVHFGELVLHAKSLPDDTIVYLMLHVDYDALGNEKIKTIGKMLDEKMLLPGEVTTLIRSVNDNGEYAFVTNRFGLAKSPPGMFEERMDNDLEKVDSRIREFYGMAARRNILETKEEQK